jgi:hypothetical protein
VLLATFVAMTAVAATYAPVTRTFPLLVGVCGSVLSAIEFTRLWRRARTEPPGRAESQRARVAMFGWVALAIVLAVIAGLVIGSAAFIVAFLRFRGRESWSFTIASAVCVIAVLYVGLERLFELPLYDGLIRW